MVFWMFTAACASLKPSSKPEIASDSGHDQVAATPVVAAPPKARALKPVPLWKDGKVAGEFDVAAPKTSREVVMDLGEEWVPYIFTERSLPTEQPVAQSTYRATYLALARGEYPTDHHGQRAKKDRYLELYGILPTLNLLRARFREAQKQDCATKLDLEPLKQYQRIVPYVDNPKAKRDSSQFLSVEQRVKQMVAKQGVEGPSKLDASRLSAAEKGVLKQYEKIAPTALVIRAAQARLACEGFFDPRANHTDGALDWATNEAIALFERKHRVFGWGFISRDTVEALKEPPLEGERQAVIRVLTERAIHSAGFIEDGSTTKGDKPPTFRGKDGKDHPIPNLEKELRESLVKAFGLETPESTLAWLDSLGDIPGEKLLAFEGPEVPEYHSTNMDLSVVIDRGDVWYEFPYDDQGKERPQPVQRRPMMTISTEYLGQKFPIARFGTTIGGWRSELIDGTEMWKYKGSPVGQRVWKQIVAAPVWLAPPGTPARTLLTPRFQIQDRVRDQPPRDRAELRVGVRPGRGVPRQVQGGGGRRGRAPGRRGDPHPRLGRLHEHHAAPLARLSPSAQPHRRAADVVRAGAPPAHSRRAEDGGLQEPGQEHRRDRSRHRIRDRDPEDRLHLPARATAAGRRAAGQHQGDEEDADHRGAPQVRHHRGRVPDARRKHGEGRSRGRDHDGRTAAAPGRNSGADADGGVAPEPVANP